MNTLKEYIEILEWLDNSGKNEEKLIDKYLVKLKAWMDKHAAGTVGDWADELKYRIEQERPDAWQNCIERDDKRLKAVVADIFPIYKKYPNNPILWPLYFAITYVINGFGAIKEAAEKISDENEKKRLNANAEKYWEEAIDINNGWGETCNIKQIYMKTFEVRKKINSQKAVNQKQWFEQNKEQLVKAWKENAERVIKFEKAA